METESKGSAFSLVELSIVLVILGLLTGGILGGQALIRAAELRSISAEFNRYSTAAQTFRDKYFAAPGDMANATAFWGTLGGSGSDNTCMALESTATSTCNGDGDGTLNSATTSVGYEWHRFWQHLSNAGLVEGRYTGTNNSGGTFVGEVPSVNVPASRLSNSYWRAQSTTTSPTETSSTYLPPARSNLFVLLSRSSGNVSLKPEEAWNIDTKLDDGIPNQGRLRSNKGDGSATFCTNHAGVAVATTTATYNLSRSSIDCMVFLYNSF